MWRRKCFVNGEGDAFDGEDLARDAVTLLDDVAEVALAEAGDFS